MIKNFTPFIWFILFGLFPCPSYGQGASFPDFSAADRYSAEQLYKLIDNTYIIPDWYSEDGKDYFCYPKVDTMGMLYCRVELATGRRDMLRDNPSSAAKPQTMRLLRSSEPSWKSFSADSTVYIYANDHDLYLRERNGADSTRLTWDGEPGFSYSSRSSDRPGNSYPVGRWMGNSHYFYSIRTDRRNVQEMAVINSLATPIPEVITYKFPTPGTDGVYRYDLLAVDAGNKTARKIDVEKFADQKIEIPLWANTFRSDGSVWFLRKNRKADTLELCRLDGKNQKLSVVITEAALPHYNEQLFRYYVLGGGSEILWWSERSGKGAYYLYAKNGRLKNAVTPAGRIVAGEVVHIDTLKRFVIVEGYGGEQGINPHYRFYYRVGLDGSGFTLLTPGDGDHRIHLSPDGRYFLDVWSRMDAVEQRVLRDVSGREIAQLEGPDITRLLASGWQPPQVLSVKAADGVTDLYGVMYTPFDMEEGRKYPIISNVYPGPQEDQVPQSFTLDDNGNQSLAQLGFVVIDFAYRGSGPLRGREFYTYGYGNLRDYALDDDMAVIAQLAQRYDFIDDSRVGIYGHSGGGFMTATAMFTHPEFYRVGVSASGNHDNNIYTQWWGESFHGVEMVGDEEGNYKFRSDIPTNIELARNLQGKLLLIHGDMDINVHPAHTMRLVDALVKAGKRFDMMILPGRDHAIDDAYYHNLIRAYFVDNLLTLPTKHEYK